MQILSQKNNHKYRKSATTKKKKNFQKMSLKFLNPKFNIFLQNNIYFLFKMPTLWSSEVDKAILEQLK